MQEHHLHNLIKNYLKQKCCSYKVGKQIGFQKHATNHPNLHGQIEFLERSNKERRQGKALLTTSPETVVKGWLPARMDRSFNPSWKYVSTSCILLP